MTEPEIWCANHGLYRDAEGKWQLAICEDDDE